MTSVQSKKSPERVKSAKFTPATIKADDIRQSATSKASHRSVTNDDYSTLRHHQKRDNTRSKSPKSPDASRKKAGSKSPKRKSNKSKSPNQKNKSGKRSTAGNRNEESSLNFSINVSEHPRSTSELENLSAQGLTLINPKIFQKNTIKTLILSGNNLRSLSSAVGQLFNLEYLDISKNPLKVRDVEDTHCLPLELRQCKKLTYLSVSECNLRHIPMTIWLCVSITHLDLSRNKISLLVPDVGNLHNIIKINLSQCNLATLPGEIGFCHHLEEIILMANQIESLPETLKDCKSLKYLRMSFRSFNSLLDSYMENLISKGQIKSEHIPMVVFELEMIHELDLKHTKINNFPENTLKNLKHLYLDYNYFENFAQQQTILALATSTSSINAASTPTNMLQPPPTTLITPPSVFTLMSSTLNVLTISNNLLKEIPIELLCLSNLEILDLSFNFIKKLPQNFSALSKLKELYLNDNKLIVLNASIGLLKNLKKLSLNNNEMVDFVEEITFKKTIEIQIGIPECVYDLVELEYFDLSYNKLTQISPKICNLFNLKKAHTYDKLNNKHGLWLIGNPLKIPPKEIWQTQNIRKIYNYLSSYVQRNLNYVYYSKLIFMGKSGVGKSQVVDSFFMDTCVPASQQQHEELSSFQSSSMIIANERTLTSKTPVKDKENVHVEFFDKEDKTMPMNRSFVINDEFEDSSLAYILNSVNKPNSGCITTRSVNAIPNMNSTSRNATSRISETKESRKTPATPTPFTSSSKVSIDYRTKVARKFYKRTSNKVEWLLLDLGGDSVYRSLNSTFLASIDTHNEPTIFVLVYNHLEYTQERHYEYLGSWIESILMHSHVDEDSPNNQPVIIQIKLIGVMPAKQNGSRADDFQNDLLTEFIIENCQMTVRNIQEKLENERQRIKTILNSQQLDEANFVFLTEGLKRLDLMLKRQVNFNENVILYDFSLKKESSLYLINELELITIRLNKIVPLELKNMLKDHLMSFRKQISSPSLSALSDYEDLETSVELDFNKKTPLTPSWMSYEEFLHNLKQSKEIINIIKTNSYCKDLTLQNVVNYAKTIGEIFWLKFSQNSNLNKKIYLKFDYILKCLQMFIKHEKNFVDYDSTMGYFKTNALFKQSLRMAKKYGILEYNLIRSICFTSRHQLNRLEIEQTLNLLKDFLLLYKSELSSNNQSDSDKLDEKRSAYFNCVCPTMCTISFEKEKLSRSKMPNFWEFDLYSNESFELFFDKLDQINMFREKVRIENGFKKETIMYNLQDMINGNDYYKDLEKMRESIENRNDDDSDYVERKIKKPDLTLINLDSIVRKEFMTTKVKSTKTLSDDQEAENQLNYENEHEDNEEQNEEIEALQKLLDQQNKLKYTHSCFIECISPFKLEKHLFNHFSVLIQDSVFERFDWSDTIIGRDLYNNCFKIRLINKNGQNDIGENKLSIEIKCLNEEYFDKLKKKFLKLIDQLFCYYPDRMSCHLIFAKISAVYLTTMAFFRRKLD